MTLIYFSLINNFSSIIFQVNIRYIEVIDHKKSPPTPCFWKVDESPAVTFVDCTAGLPGIVPLVTTLSNARYICRKLQRVKVYLSLGVSHTNLIYFYFHIYLKHYTYLTETANRGITEERTFVRKSESYTKSKSFLKDRTCWVSFFCSIALKSNFSNMTSNWIHEWKCVDVWIHKKKIKHI